MITRYIKTNILLLASLAVISSCKKETTAGISKEVKVSYPEVTLKGDPIVILPVGGTFTDAGATVKDDISGQVSDLTPTSNTVNVQEPGLYQVNYVASNANGFESSAARLVAVTSVTGTTDRSGTYLRSATGINAYVEQLAEGVYKITNPGGAGIGQNTVVYVVETEKGVYSCPPQPTDVGTMEVTEINFTDTGATWRVLNVEYGTGLRTFQKQ